MANESIFDLIPDLQQTDRGISEKKQLEVAKKAKEKQEILSPSNSDSYLESYLNELIGDPSLANPDVAERANRNVAQFIGTQDQDRLAPITGSLHGKRLAQSSPTTFGEDIADAVISMGQGLTSTGMGTANLIAAQLDNLGITKDALGTTTHLEEGINDFLNKNLRTLKGQVANEKFQAELERRERRRKATGEDGLLDQILDTGGSLLRNPSQFGNFLGEGIGSLAGFAAGTKGLDKVFKLSKLGINPYVALGAITEGGSAASQTYEAVMNMPEEKLKADPNGDYNQLLKQGYTPEDARIIVAHRAANIATPGSLVAGAVGGKISESIIKNPFTGGGHGMVGASLREAFEDGLQEGTSQFGQNLGIQRTIDKNQDLFDNVGVSATMGAASGGITGGGMAAPVSTVKLGAKGILVTANKFISGDKETTELPIENSPEAVAKSKENILNREEPVNIYPADPTDQQSIKDAEQVQNSVNQADTIIKNDMYAEIEAAHPDLVKYLDPERRSYEEVMEDLAIAYDTTDKEVLGKDGFLIVSVLEDNRKKLTQVLSDLTAGKEVTVDDESLTTINDYINVLANTVNSLDALSEALVADDPIRTSAIITKSIREDIANNIGKNVSDPSAWERTTKTLTELSDKANPIELHQMIQQVIEFAESPESAISEDQLKVLKAMQEFLSEYTSKFTSGSEVSRVAGEIISDDSSGKKGPSLYKHLTNVMDGILNGDLESASKSLRSIGRLAFTLTAKVDALNKSFKANDPRVKTKHQAYDSRGRLITSSRGYNMDRESPSSLGFAVKVDKEAEIARRTFDRLATMFPEIKGDMPLFSEGNPIRIKGEIADLYSKYNKSKNVNDTTSKLGLGEDPFGSKSTNTETTKTKVEKPSNENVKSKEEPKVVKEEPTNEPKVEIKETTPNNEINIYAGTNENGNLSNFAHRPFTINVKTKNGSAPVKFHSVEQAFHFYKARIAGREDLANEILKTKSGGKLRALTSNKNLKMTPEQLDTWNKNSEKIMKKLMYESFKQNPESSEALLNTGDAKLTHKKDGVEQDNGRFSKVITEVRELLRNQPTKEATAPKEKENTEVKNKEQEVVAPEKVEVKDNLEGKYDSLLSEVNNALENPEKHSKGKLALFKRIKGLFKIEGTFNLSVIKDKNNKDKFLTGLREIVDSLTKFKDELSETELKQIIDLVADNLANEEIRLADSLFTGDVYDNGQIVKVSLFKFDGTSEEFNEIIIIKRPAIMDAKTGKLKQPAVAEAVQHVGEENLAKLREKGEIEKEVITQINDRADYLGEYNQGIQGKAEANTKVGEDVVGEGNYFVSRKLKRIFDTTGITSIEQADSQNEKNKFKEEVLSLIDTIAKFKDQIDQGLLEDTYKLIADTMNHLGESLTSDLAKGDPNKLAVIDEINSKFNKEETVSETTKVNKNENIENTQTIEQEPISTEEEVLLVYNKMSKKERLEHSSWYVDTSTEIGESIDNLIDSDEEYSLAQLTLTDYLVENRKDTPKEVVKWLRNSYGNDKEVMPKKLLNALKNYNRKETKDAQEKGELPLNLEDQVKKTTIEEAENVEDTFDELDTDFTKQEEPLNKEDIETLGEPEEVSDEDGSLAINNEEDLPEGDNIGIFTRTLNRLFNRSNNKERIIITEVNPNGENHEEGIVVLSQKSLETKSPIIKSDGKYYIDLNKLQKEGLSSLLDLRVGGDTLRNNLANLGIDPESIETGFKTKEGKNSLLEMAAFLYKYAENKDKAIKDFEKEKGITIQELKDANILKALHARALLNAIPKQFLHSVKGDNENFFRSRYSKLAGSDENNFLYKNGDNRLLGDSNLLNFTNEPKALTKGILTATIKGIDKYIRSNKNIPDPVLTELENSKKAANFQIALLDKIESTINKLLENGIKNNKAINKALKEGNLNKILNYKNMKILSLTEEVTNKDGTKTLRLNKEFSEKLSVAALSWYSQTNSSGSDSMSAEATLRHFEEKVAEIDKAIDNLLYKLRKATDLPESYASLISQALQTGENISYPADMPDYYKNEAESLKRQYEDALIMKQAIIEYLDKYGADNVQFEVANKSSQTMMREVKTMLGISTKDDTYIGDEMAFFYNIASELLSAMSNIKIKGEKENRPLVDLQPLKTNYGETIQVKLPSGEFLTYFARHYPGDSKLLDSTLKNNLLATRENVSFFMEPTQANDRIKNSPNSTTPLKKAVIQDMNNTPNKINHPLVEVFDAIGEEELINRLVPYADVPDNLMNKKHKATRDGQRLSFSEAFKLPNKIKAFFSMYTGKNEEDPTVYIDYQVTHGGRYYGNGTVTAQSSPLLRQTVNPAYSQLDVDNPNDIRSHITAVAQTFGAKTEHTTYNDVMDMYEKARSYLEDNLLKYLTNFLNGDEEAIVDFLNHFESSMEGLDAEHGFRMAFEPRVINGLVEMARFQEHINKGEEGLFDSYLYPESDGITSGPANTTLLLNGRNFKTKTLSMAGIRVNENAFVENNAEMRKLNDGKDIYTTTADAGATKHEKIELAKVNPKKPTFNIVKNALDTVFEMSFGKDVEVGIDDKGNYVLFAKRNLAKNPITQKLYGANSKSISVGFADSIAGQIYEGFTRMLVSLNRNGSRLDAIREFFKGHDLSDQEAVDRYIQFLRAIDILSSSVVYFSEDEAKYKAFHIKGSRDISSVIDVKRKDTLEQLKNFEFRPKELEQMSKNINTLFTQYMVSGIVDVVGEEAFHHQDIIATNSMLSSALFIDTKNSITNSIIEEKMSKSKEEKEQGKPRSYYEYQFITKKEDKETTKLANEMFPEFRTMTGSLDQVGTELQVLGDPKVMKSDSLTAGSAGTILFQDSRPSLIGIRDKALATFSIGDAAILDIFFTITRNLKDKFKVLTVHDATVTSTKDAEQVTKYLNKATYINALQPHVSRMAQRAIEHLNTFKEIINKDGKASDTIREQGYYNTLATLLAQPGLWESATPSERFMNKSGNVLNVITEIMSKSSSKKLTNLDLIKEYLKETGKPPMSPAEEKAISDILDAPHNIRRPEHTAVEYLTMDAETMSNIIDGKIADNKELQSADKARIIKLLTEPSAWQHYSGSSYRDFYRTLGAGKGSIKQFEKFYKRFVEGKQSKRDKKFKRDPKSMSAIFIPKDLVDIFSPDFDEKWNKAKEEQAIKETIDETSEENIPVENVIETEPVKKDNNKPKNTSSNTNEKGSSNSKYEKRKRLIGKSVEEVMKDRKDGKIVKVKPTSSSELLQILGLGDENNPLANEVIDAILKSENSALKGLTITIGTRKFLNDARFEESYLEGINLEPLSKEHIGTYNPENNTLYLNSEATNAETVAHELLHTVTFQTVINAYKNWDSAPKDVQQAILNLERAAEAMIDYYAKVPYLERNHTQMSLGLYKFNMNTTRGKILAVGEVISWGLTNPEVRNYMNNKMDKKPNSILERVAQAIKGLYLSILNALGVKDMHKESLLRTIAESSTLLMMTDPASLEEKASLDIEAHYLTKPENRLNQLMIEFQRAVRKNLLAPNRQSSSLEKRAEDIKKTKDMINSLDGVINALSVSGFELDQEKNLAGKIILLGLNSKNITNQNSLIELSKVYNDFIKQVKLEDFLPENPSSNDYLLAEEKYKFITGINSNKEALDKGIPFKSFVILSTLDPEFRNVLSKFNVDKVKAPKSPDSKMDTFLNRVGYGLIEAMSNFINKTRSNKTGNALAQFDLLLDTINKINKQEVEHINLLDKTSNLTFSVVDYLNERTKSLIGLIVDPIYNKFLVSKEGDNLLLKSGKVIGSVALGLFSENSAENNAKLIRSAINNLKGAPKFIREFTNDMLGHDEYKGKLARIVNQTKTEASKVRQENIEKVPKVIASKFSERMTKDNWRTITNDFMRGDLVLFNSDEDINLLKNVTKSKNNLKKAIKDLENKLGNIPSKADVLKKAKQLANYLATGETGSNLLRNASLIMELRGEVDHNMDISHSKSDIKTLDKLISLYYLELQNEGYLNNLNSLISKEEEGIKFLSRYIDGQKKRENHNKDTSKRGYINQLKGYVPYIAGKNGSVILADMRQAKHLKKRGYKFVRPYKGDAFSRKAGNLGYFQSPFNAKNPYHQGAIQTARETINGVDLETGVSVIPNGGLITDPKLVKEIYDSMQRNNNPVANREGLVPIYRDGSNIPVAYEIQLDMALFESLKPEKYAPNLIGSREGRFFEEYKGHQFNEVAIRLLHEMWENTPLDERGEFIDILDPKEQEKDPVLRDAINTLPPKALELMQSINNGKFYVRRTEVNDAVGYRMFMLNDIWNGNTRMHAGVRKALQHFFEGILGDNAYKYLMYMQTGVQGVVRHLRHIIVISSVVVPVINALSNVMQLVVRGVPATDIAKYTALYTAEARKYEALVEDNISLRAHIRASIGKPEQNKYINQLKTNEEAIKKLAIYPLIEAGEYNSISDGMKTLDGGDLIKGDLTGWIENRINRLPKGLKETGRQLLLLQDTSLFKGLQIFNDYGDFISKAIFYRHLIERKEMSKDKALRQINTEFINYNLLPGRARHTAENLGLLWFYNWTLRATSVMFAMLRENPFTTLLSIASPGLKLPSMGTIGIPTDDSLIPKLLEGNGIKSIGMFGRSIGLNPYWNVAKAIF